MKWLVQVVKNWRAKVSTKLDMDWAEQTLENVKALILEVQRLEEQVHNLEDECEDLKEEIYKLREARNGVQ